MIDRFFRPFLGGIFFDNSLSTTSRMTRYVLRQLALGDNCLPAKGIGALSEQLANKIPSSKLLLGTPGRATVNHKRGTQIRLAPLLRVLATVLWGESQLRAIAEWR